MIPRRVYLKGFMCYREETEICFRGSTIWALSGPNGAGKSAIFDAMRYALYDEHRMGKQNDDELIHHDVKEFVIEFDFAIGENEYRIKRTCSRKKRVTRLAIHLCGPDAPVLGRTGPQTIPGTETETGFKEWILHTIGLDEKAFTVSVLLLQGKSDTLLKLGSAARHDVLTQIIDLSRYDALQKRAVKNRNEQEGYAKVYKGQLDNLEIVDEIHLLDLGCQVGKAQACKEEARQRQLILTRLKEQAKRWEQLQTEEEQLVRNLARYEELLNHAVQIEQQASRLDALQKAMPSLTQIYHKQNEAVCYRGQIEQCCDKVESHNTELEKLREKLHAARQLLSDLQAQQALADDEQKQLQPCLRDLQLACSEIARLQDKQQQYQKYAQEIATYPHDLEQQQQQLRQQLNDLEQVGKALPHLKQFAQARNIWQQSTQGLTRIDQDLSDQEALLEESTKQIQILQKTAQKAPIFLRRG